MTQPNHIGQRLRALRGKFSIEELATRIGVNKNTLGAYERGERLPDVDFLAVFASILECSFAELLDARLRSSQSPEARDAANTVRGIPDPSSANGYVDVPYAVGEPAAAYGNTFANGPEPARLGFRHEWLAEQGLNAVNLELMTIRGDSMQGTLHPGDVLLIDRSRCAPNEEGLYVLTARIGKLVKRLQLLPSGRIRITSDNPAYANIDVSPEAFSLGANSVYRIYGRVVWVGCRVF